MDQKHKLIRRYHVSDAVHDSQAVDQLLMRGNTGSGVWAEAITTGHGGSFTTLHAQTARKAMDRLALMVMGRGTQLRYPEVMRYLRSAIDLVIQAGLIGNERGIAEVYMPPLDLENA